MTSTSVRNAIVAVVVGLGALLPRLAGAQGYGYVAVQPALPDLHHTVSVTFSPVHLILPILEVSAEFRLRPRVSVAAIAGGGSFKVQGLTDSIAVFEIGAQGRFYFLGNFDHGLHLGLEGIYVGASTSSGGSAILADGFSIGPLLGYKIAARFGLTFEIQGGVQYVAARASGSSSSGSTSTSSARAIQPLLNINIGWSF